MSVVLLYRLSVAPPSPLYGVRWLVSHKPDDHRLFRGCVGTDRMLVFGIGFYYVCVDFNPQHTGSLGSQASQHLPLPELPACPEEIIPSSSMNSSSLVKPELSPRARRESVNRGAQRLGRSSSGSRSAPSPNVATMSGFYFHQNSEP